MQQNDERNDPDWKVYEINVGRSLSSSRKLVIISLVSSCHVIVLGLGGIVSVICPFILSS